jgi:hypothetical protein
MSHLSLIDADLPRIASSLQQPGSIRKLQLAGGR